MSYLPIWNGIMKGTFRRGGANATSAPGESEFSGLKTTVFRQLLRADKFILSHIEYLNEKVRIAVVDGIKIKEKLIQTEKEQKISTKSVKKKVQSLSAESIESNSRKVEIFFPFFAPFEKIREEDLSEDIFKANVQRLRMFHPC